MGQEVGVPKIQQPFVISHFTSPVTPIIGNHMPFLGKLTWLIQMVCSENRIPTHFHDSSLSGFQAPFHHLGIYTIYIYIYIHIYQFLDTPNIPNSLLDGFSTSHSVQPCRQNRGAQRPDFKGPTPEQQKKQHQLHPGDGWGTLWLCQNCYWTWPSMAIYTVSVVSFPIKQGDFPYLC